MEGLLCSQEMAKIDSLFKKSYDLKSNRLFFPVRHHSPACSFHLAKVIDEYGPDIILIEGPCDTNSTLQYIEHDESQAPLCIYYSYSDKKGLLGEKDGKYRCYYPFLDYSPELVAIRQAKTREIPTRFIDLPYPEILLNSSRGAGLQNEAPKVSYNDDYLMERSRFLQGLCEKEGCRNFSELWEKLYEIDGIRLKSEDFIRNMLAFCYLSRIDYSQEMLQSEGCTAREKFMAGNIREAMRNHEKVLIVTGGFHTWGLVELLDEEEETSLKFIEHQDAGTYAMAYSFEESDQLNGYASGMPYPAFYQKVWEGVCDREENPYEKAALHYIVRCGGQLRKNDTALSTADEIEAYNMAKGLAALREKAECGVFELFDGVRVSFVKGELSVFDKAPLEVLRRLLTGKKIGKLCGHAEVPPIVKDFREKASRLKLKVNTTVEQEIVLDIYKNPRHREISKLLHIMLFLETGFCKKVKGPDFINKKNTSLVRETWKYRWSTAIESSLIEVSVYGGSLEEAAGEVVKKRLKEIGEHAGDMSLLLIDTYMMGLNDRFDEIAQYVSEAISRDGVFYSIADCTYNLCFLYSGGKLLGSSAEGGLEKLVKESYYKAVMLTPGIYNTSAEEENRVISRLKDLYHLTLQRDLGLNHDPFTDALANITQKVDCNSSVEGASIGILIGMGKVDRSFAIVKAEGYLYGTGEKFLESAGFLKGLFSTARDTVFYDDEFIKGIDHVIRNMQEEDFMKILPDLRLSFSFFTPNEINEIAETVSEVYSATKEGILKAEAISPEEIRLGTELDSLVVGAFKRWGLMNEQ